MYKELKETISTNFHQMKNSKIGTTMAYEKNTKKMENITRNCGRQIKKFELKSVIAEMKHSEHI